jgi:hypothetical protein
MRRGFATPGGLVGNRGNFGAGNCDELLQIWQRSIALVKKLAKRSIALVGKLGNDRPCGKIC